MSDLEQVPIGSWWNPDVTPHELDGMLTANNGRLVSLAVRSVSPLRLAAVWIEKTADDAHASWAHDLDTGAVTQKLADKTKRLVCLAPYVRAGKVQFAVAWIPNSGANAIASSGDPDVDVKTLGSKLSDANARLVVLRSYVVDGKRHHAAVWVDNTGANHIPWGWKPDVDADALDALVGDRRLCCLDPYMDGDTLKLGAVWLANTGAHGKAWWWYHGLDAAKLGHKLDQFCSYPAELQTYPVGADTHFACAMYMYPQADPEGTKLVEVTGSAQVVSQSDSMAPRDQSQSLSLTIKNVSSSPVSITNGMVHLNESGGFVDNSWPLLGPGNLLGASVDLAPGAQGTYALTYGWGGGPSNFVVDLRAASGSSQQHLHAVVPIANPGFPAPPAITAPTPVYLGLWRDPTEVLSLWRDGGEKLWISIAGQLVNTTDFMVELASWHLRLTFDGKTVVDEDLPPAVWAFGLSGQETAPVTNGAAWLGGLLSFFAFGFTLKNVAKDFTHGKVELSANYKSNGACGACTYTSSIKRVDAVTIHPPFKALPAHRSWNFGNGPDHNGYDSHEWPAERYAYDITVVDDSGSTHTSTDTAKMHDNHNFYAYGQPIVAVKAGNIWGADDTNPENFGSKTNPAVGSTQNYVLVKHHDGTFAGYYHVRQGKNVFPKQTAGTLGPPVSAGDKLAEIGNAGGSGEPHLHFAYTILDGRGLGSVTPVVFTGLKTKTGHAVDAVPPNGVYKL